MNVRFCVLCVFLRARVKKKLTSFHLTLSPQPATVPPHEPSKHARYLCKPGACPFGGRHALNGNEYALGCGKCAAGEE